MTVLLSLTALAALTLAARVLPRLLRPYAISSDAFYHLLAADRIKENGYRLPERLRGLFFPGPYDYPPLFHFALALVPRRLSAWMERLVSPLVDVAYVWLCFGFMWWLTRVTGDPAGMQKSFFLAAIFSLSPALLYTGRGPRTYNANPRIVSELVFGFAMACTARFFLLHDPWSFVGASAGIAVLLLSSKFGAQVVLVVYPATAALVRDWTLLGIPAVGLAFALVPWRGHYLRVLKGHIGHLSLFGRLGTLTDSGMARRSEWRELFAMIGSLHRPRSWYRLLCLNSIATFVIRNPQLVPVFVLFAAPSYGPIEGLLIAWIVTTIVAFLIISLRPLLFLGEPERYVSYSVLAQFGLLAMGFDRLPGAWLWALLGYNVVVAAAYQILFIELNRKDVASRAAGAELREFFTAFPRVCRILPIGEGPYNLAYMSGHEVFYPCGNFQVWHTPVREYLRIYEDFVRPRPETVIETLRRYRIDTIVVNKRNDAHRFPVELFGSTTLFENETFRVIDVSQLMHQAEPLDGVCA